MSSSSRSGRRVVITGLGLISPLGNTPDALWEALSAGRSGVAALTQHSPGSLPTSFGAEARQFTGGIDDFGALEGDQKKQIRKALKVMCRECQMGVASAQLALDHARFPAAQRDPERSGIVYGSDYMVSTPDELSAPIEACLDPDRSFHFERWGPQGLGAMNPLWLLKYLPNMPASHVAIYNDLRGPNNSITEREASANLAVGEAFRVIARNHADAMLAGATGTRIHPMKAIHAKLSEQLATANGSPEKASRPFDLHRSGMVLGEGAGAIVLEELEHAQARGATIHAEVVAASSSAVVDRQFAAKRDQALVNAMRAALGEAGLAPEEVGHLHAHGLSTTQSDIDEARAIREVFGRHADRIPVTAAKSYFGNLGAGSGVIELIASTLALARGRLFPVLNYETPDPACPVAAVAGGADPGDSFLNLSVTPQGQASCVIVRRFDSAS
ncbi:MAG TPA: beta-ketoacyl-[acyl-carrier-protein] synthase family protein [Pirellulales bacterium]|nr:beta-ketoacyl-[acyl-carrier-protein] synthase family protein [Pirellulales bacterium]